MEILDLILATFVLSVGFGGVWFFVKMNDEENKGE
jgi:hypothetical protein